MQGRGAKDNPKGSGKGGGQYGTCASALGIGSIEENLIDDDGLGSAGLLAREHRLSM
jgi:hypothetical protein